MLVDSSREIAPVANPHAGPKDFKVRRDRSARLRKPVFASQALYAASRGQPRGASQLVGVAAAAQLAGRRPGPVGGIGKRLTDIVAAITIGLVSLPLIGAVALAVKIGMGGPVIFRHRRVGFGGKEFYCLKFRTMLPNGDEILARHLAENPAAAAEWRLNRKLANDPRVTRLGSFLRKSSLDELPQLLNILRGEMSCVGPRPVAKDELERYGADVGAYLSARPGITGSWQVSGRSSLSYDERVKLDAQYVRKWSFGSDVLIMVRTVPALLKVDEAA